MLVTAQLCRNPPTPALAKAGAAPGTTAGVELVFLSNRHPKATPMASYGRPSLPLPKTLQKLQTVTTLQKRLGMPNRAGKSYPKARSIASSGRSSLPFASP